ncbi:hypothetical protein NH340_JMT08187 [Sarcoptes scabiei]|nr:hypothetical protein NH340_JMT08187 [Sarcoptes scabiei]
MSHFDCSELSIPIGYGRLQAKIWRSKIVSNHSELIKVLAVHGWQDNAGTFDRLFPLLTIESMMIVAIDLPGHGSSSHLPRGVPYTDLTWTLAIKHALDHLDWQTNITIIAHSMGAIASQEFVLYFPDRIKRLILLDTVKPKIFQPEQISIEMANCLNAYCRSDSIVFERSNSFRKEKALDIIIESHLNGRITRDGARCLMERALESDPNRSDCLRFKRDPRLNQIIRKKFTRQQLIDLLGSLRCEMLILKAKQTHPTLHCPYIDEFVELFRNNCLRFRFELIDGDHYLHLTRPETISEIIKDFIGNR